MDKITDRFHKSDKLIRIGVIVFATALIVVALYCRLRLLSAPLERDEGGFAYIGQQILRGIPPFESGNMKVLGGIHFAYALIMAFFGESARGIHTGLLLINIATMSLIYFLAKRLLSFEATVLTVGAYAFLSTSQTVLGVFAHATHFVMLFVLAGLVSLLKGLDEDRRSLIVTSGLCFGTSVLMKQHGVLFCLFALCLITSKKLKQNNNKLKAVEGSALLVSGMLAPYTVISIYMFARGVFTEFWFWTFTYSLDYAGIYSISQGMEYLTYKIARFYYYQKYVWILGGLGLLLACSSIVKLRERWLILSFTLVSCMIVTPGNAYYPHYFIFVIPALSILIGVAFETLPPTLEKITTTATARRAVLFLACSAFAISVYHERDYLFNLSPEAVSRMVYGSDIFSVSTEIAAYIKAHSEQKAKIAIIGSEPQIYFYAQRTAATDYLYMYPLARAHTYVKEMQTEMIREVEKAAPEYIIFINANDSWMDGTTANRIVDWLDSYLARYEKVGLVELSATVASTCYWGEAAVNHLPATNWCVLIFRKMY